MKPRMRNISKKAQERAAKKDKRARSIFKASDSFQNFALKLGIGTDNALSESTYGFNPITHNRVLLEWIHRGSWLGGVAVDVVADDMTRAGIDIISELDPDDQEVIERDANRLNIWPAVNDVVKWSRLYGGALGMFMIDGQDVSQPFRLESVGPDQFKGILVLDRWMVEPSLTNLVTDLGPDFGLPKYYDTMAAGVGIPRMHIHYTRVFRMEGIRLPHWQSVMEMLWGASIIERLYDRMLAFDSATQGAAQLVYKSYLRTYKVKNLRQIASQGGEALDGLGKYVDMMRHFQSIEGVTLMDLEDEFEAVQHSGFAGISDALIQFGQQLSGALQIPLVRLFGQSPTGMNSSGESDLRTYYDGIQQKQESNLRIPIDIIYRCIAQSAGIKIPDSFTFHFAPLWQMKDEDKVNAANQATAAIVNAVDSGLVRAVTGLKELRGLSRITGVWQNITDEEIEEADDMPTPLEQSEHQMEIEKTKAENPPGLGEKPGGKPAGGEEKPKLTAIKGGGSA